MNLSAREQCGLTVNEHTKLSKQRDTTYGELHTMAPGLFPESISHPADQLVHMYEVGRSITKSEKNLREYHGADAVTYRKWAKNDFDAVVGDVMRELQTVKKYADDKAARDAEEARKVPITQEEAMAAHLQDGVLIYATGTTGGFFAQ